jgi:hypothetical protein
VLLEALAELEERLGLAAVVAGEPQGCQKWPILLEELEEDLEQLFKVTLKM